MSLQWGKCSQVEAHILSPHSCSPDSRDHGCHKESLPTVASLGLTLFCSNPLGCTLKDRCHAHPQNGA